jgi:hypothetical protein
VPLIFSTLLQELLEDDQRRKREICGDMGKLIARQEAGSAQLQEGMRLKIGVRSLSAVECRQFLFVAKVERNYVVSHDVHRRF